MFSKLPDRNNTSFSYALAAAMERMRLHGERSRAKIAASGKSDKLSDNDNDYLAELQFHQNVSMRYVIETGQRGIYLVHYMGSGKSRTGVAIMEQLRVAYPDYQLIFMSMKSLHANFTEEFTKYYREVGLDDTTIAEKLRGYKFVSSNAGNLLTQLRRNQGAVLNLDNTVMLCDEFHEICNAIVNGSTNAVGFYEAVMRAKNFHIVAMSGTPITGNPYEFAVAMNMISGTKLFGEDYDKFNEYFVTKPDALNPDAPAVAAGIANADKFVARILGLVSCYNPVWDESSDIASKFPTLLPPLTCTVNMSEYQYRMYGVARDYEIMETQKRTFAISRANIARKSSSGTSTYRVASRQLSNFAFPEHACDFEGDAKKLTYVRHMGKLTDDDMHDLSKYSPKMLALFYHLSLLVPGLSENAEFMRTAKLGEKWSKLKRTKTGGIREKTVRYSRGVRGGAEIATGKEKLSWQPGLGIVYSGFDDSGVEVVARALEAHRLSRYGESRARKTASSRKIDKKDADNSSDVPDVPDVPEDANIDINIDGAGPQMFFGIISGDMDVDQRTSVRQAFATAKNQHGDTMALLLITSTGATGISTVGVTHVHLFDQYWKPSREDQVITRAYRYLSHEHMPKEFRVVQSISYLADYPESYSREGGRQELTTDLQMHAKLIILRAIIDTFMLAIFSASVDCVLWASKFLAKHGMHCHICTPTDERLFVADLREDMQTPSRCRAPKTADIQAKKISHDGVDYAYYRDKYGDLKIVMHNPGLGNYVPIGPEHPHWQLLVDTIE